MQNTITMERTLQCVEAGQVHILKEGICGVVQNITNSHVLLSFCFKSYLEGGLLAGMMASKVFVVTNGHC